MTGKGNDMLACIAFVTGSAVVSFALDVTLVNIMGPRLAAVRRRIIAEKYGYPKAADAPAAAGDGRVAQKDAPEDVFSE